MATGKKTKGDVDHKNRDRSDNRPCNLRESSRSDNLKNRVGWAKPKPKVKPKAKPKKKPPLKPKTKKRPIKKLPVKRKKK